MQEHKRVKHGDLPGDYSKRAKIRMREKRGLPFRPFPWIEIGERCAKAFRKIVQDKGRTVQRRRDQQAIQHGMED